MSFRRAIQASQNIHDRGFAGARRPHHGDKFSFAHFQRNPAQRLDLNLAQIVGFVNIFEANDGLAAVGGPRSVDLRSWFASAIGEFCQKCELEPARNARARPRLRR